jgi:hypothetical protein
MIKHTCSGGVTADEETINSYRCTLSGGVTADVVAVGSCRCTLSRGRLVVDKVTIGSCGSYGEGPIADVVTIGSCRS